MRILFFVIFQLALAKSAFPQSKEYKVLRYKKRDFQLSFFPGISSNGTESGHYFNKYSINLFGGISAGNSYLEIGGTTNLNTNSGGGIQLAGLANVVGSNTFLNMTLHEERDAIKEGFSSDFHGIQVSGVVNYVRNFVQGIQVSGGFNVTNGDAWAIQFAGLGNSVAHSHSGIQIAGLFNSGFRQAGTQISLLHNVTRGNSNGLQLGLFNSSNRMKGKSSNPPTKARSAQVGLFNKAKTMEGVQIGLINFGGLARGTQIGIINFFKTAPPEVHGKGHLPIGLLNFGSNGHVRLYANELFMTSVEFTTGNCSNCTKTMSGMPLSGKFLILNQNALILAYNPLGYGSNIKWAFGYGFEKVFLNKHSMLRNDLKNQKRMLNMGIRWMHLNHSDELEKSLSLLTRMHTDIVIRTRYGYIFAGFSFNAYVFDNTPIEHHGLGIHSERVENLNYQLWLGYSAGLHLDI